MAFKLKQRWLHQFQEQQADHKLKSSSSTHGDNVGDPNAATDAASKPTPQQRAEPGAKTSGGQAAPAVHCKKQRSGEGSRPTGQTSGFPAKRKRDEDGARPAAKVVTEISWPRQQQQQQQQQQQLPAKVATREPSAAVQAAGTSRDGGKQHPKVEALPPAVKQEAASAGSNPSTSQHQPPSHAAQQEAASAQQQPQLRVKEEAVPADDLGWVGASNGAMLAGAASPPQVVATSIPVEVEARPSAKAQPLGELPLSVESSYGELLTAIQAAFGERLPRKAGMRLVYQDADGDWLLLLPDVPWQLFAGSVRRLLVTYK
ncbi:hypothetical protein N2152v2_001105 [Parachlorella kessleri]